MVRRVLLAVLAGAFALAFAPAAFAQDPSPPFTFEHDGTRDGTPTEITSGFSDGGDLDNSNGDTLADRYENTYETFYFRVPEGTDAGSFTVDIQWGDPRIDFDLYVYRVRPDGGIVAANVASSAAGGTTEETAIYTPRNIGDPIEPDRYLVVVDNWCSRDADDDPESSDPADTADCGIGEEIPDEDDFTGSVTYGPREQTNSLPTVTLAGPDTGTTGKVLQYTAQGTDTGGGITNYKFDLNGDGFFETNTLSSGAASTSFSNPGTYNVGVQVTDNAGDTGYASKAVKITGPGGQPKPAVLKPLRSFKLGRPVFGGRKSRKLVVSYRLRERGRVTLSLYRGKKRIKRLATGQKRANRTYRVSVKPRKLKRGRYSVRMTVRAATGKRQTARLSAKKL